MKVLIDRGHFVIEQLLGGKYCVTVATGENYGSRDAGKVLDKLVLNSGGRLAARIVVNAPFNSIRPGSKTDPKIDRLAGRAGAKIYKAVSRQKTYPLQALYHGIIFGFGIKPFVLRKGDKYKGVINKWKGEMI